jgi:hypothetical protein
VAGIGGRQGLELPANVKKKEKEKNIKSKINKIIRINKSIK